MNEINTDPLSNIEELQAILRVHKEAKSYLESFKWCRRVKTSRYSREYCIFEKLCVFLFEIEASEEGVDQFIWVIAGDLPSVYLDQSISTPKEALETYCDLMKDWIDSIQNGGDPADTYPVAAERTHENAELLARRISFIRGLP